MVSFCKLDHVISSLLQWRRAASASQAVVKGAMDIEVTVDAERQLTLWTYIHLQEKKVSG